MSAEGEALCRVCFNEGLMAAQETRATEEYYGLEVTGRAQDLGSRMRKMGWALTVAGIPIALVGVLGSGRILALGVLTTIGGITLIARAGNARIPLG